MRLHRRPAVLSVVALAAALLTASPAQAGWQSAEPVTTDDPAVTDVGAAYLGTAPDGEAVTAWLEWRGSDARLMASRRAVDGSWGPPQLVDDLSEHPAASGGRVAVTSMVVLPDASAVIAYAEYDEEADASFMGRIVRVAADGTVTPHLSGPERQWELSSDDEGDWLATAREYDSCACENYTYYSDDGAAPEYLGTYLGFGLRFSLSRRELVYYAVYDDDGFYELAPTLGVRRIDAATSEVSTAVVLKPDGAVSGFDLDAGVADDVVLAWSVRHEERRVPDLVRAVRHPSGGAWSKPHTVVTSGGDGNRRIGAPVVDLGEQGRALVVWSSPRNDAGRVDLDSAIVRPVRPSSSIRTLAGDLAPTRRALTFGIRVNDDGQAVVAFSHASPCESGADAGCHTVSAVRGRMARLPDPKALLTSSEAGYETVTTALSESGVGIVLTVEAASTRIVTRTSRPPVEAARPS